MKDAIAEATRADVSFYGVDARGLGAGLDEAIDIGGVPVDDPDFQAPTSLIQNEVRRAQDNLRVMSEQTGGFAIVNQNDLNAAFERIVEDNSSYYVLGYYPSNDKRDGRFRKSRCVSRAGHARAGAQRLHGAEREVRRGRPAHARTRRCRPRSWKRSPAPFRPRELGLSIFAAPVQWGGSKSSVALSVEFAPATLEVRRAERQVQRGHRASRAGDRCRREDAGRRADQRAAPAEPGESRRGHRPTGSGSDARLDAAPGPLSDSGRRRRNRTAEASARSHSCSMCRTFRRRRFS